MKSVSDAAYDNPGRARRLGGNPSPGPGRRLLAAASALSVKQESDLLRALRLHGEGRPCIPGRSAPVGANVTISLPVSECKLKTRYYFSLPAFAGRYTQSPFLTQSHKTGRKAELPYRVGYSNRDQR